MTAFNLDTAGYDSKSYSITSGASIPYGGFFKSDGLTFFIVDNSTGYIYEYSMSTAWDISTASYTSSSFDTTTNHDPIDIVFNSDGTKMFLLCNNVGTNQARLAQYSLSTAWDITTASYDSIDVNLGFVSMYGLHVSPNGEDFYYIEGTNDRAVNVPVSTAWDLSTSGSTSYYDFSSEEGSPKSIALSNDGTKLFIFGDDAPDSIHQYTLSTAWDITSASYDSVSYDVSSEVTGTPANFSWDADGGGFFVTSTGVPDKIFQYSVDLFSQPIVAVQGSQTAEVEAEKTGTSAAVSDDPGTIAVQGHQYAVADDEGTSSDPDDYCIAVQGEQRAVAVANTIGDNNFNYFATKGFTTSAGSTPAGEEIPPTLKNPGNFSKALNIDDFGVIRPSFGEIVISNLDGTHDDLLTKKIQGQPATLYYHPVQEIFVLVVENAP